MEKYMKRSPITGRTYNYFSKDIVRLLNLEQIFFYIEEMGIIPLDIVLSEDRKHVGKKVIVFIFNKDETKEAYQQWIDNKENSDGEQKDLS